MYLGLGLDKCLKFKKINASRVNPVQQEFAFRNSTRSDCDWLNNCGQGSSNIVARDQSKCSDALVK